MNCPNLRGKMMSRLCSRHSSLVMYRNERVSVWEFMADGEIIRKEQMSFQMVDLPNALRKA
jgi:hypothetical protein